MLVDSILCSLFSSNAQRALLFDVPLMATVTLRKATSKISIDNPLSARAQFVQILDSDCDESAAA
jgi:hypothetical protein